MEENNVVHAEVQNAQPLLSNKKLKLKLILPLIVVILFVLVGALFILVLNNNKSQNSYTQSSLTPTPEASGQTTTANYKPKNPTLVEVLNLIKTKDNTLIKDIPDPEYVVQLFYPFVWYDNENFLLQPDHSQMIIMLNDKKDIAPVTKDIQSYLIGKGFSENDLNTSKLKLEYEKVAARSSTNHSDEYTSIEEFISAVAVEKNDQKCTILGYDYQYHNKKYPNTNADDHMIQINCSEGNYLSQKALFLENAYDTDGSLMAIKLGAKDENFAIGANHQGMMNNGVILKREGNKWITIWAQWGQQAMDCSLLTDKGLTESDIAALGIKDTNGQCQ
jgi:hypothetical protein